MPYGIAFLSAYKYWSRFGNPDYDERGDFNYGALFLINTRFNLDKKLGKDALLFCKKNGVKTESQKLKTLIRKAIASLRQVEADNSFNKSSRNDEIKAELGKNLRETIAELKKSK